MKTAITDNSGVVLNVGTGAAAGEPPEGMQYHLIEDSVPVGIGWTLQEDGSFLPKSTTAPIEDRQSDAWDRIKAKRDRVKAGGAKTSGYWFHSDDASRIQFLGLKDEGRDILAAGGAATDPIVIDGEAVQWKTMAKDANGDPIFAAMTVQLAFDIVAATKVLDALAFANAEAHRISMLASDTPETYDYSTGWPAIYVPPA